MGGGGGSKIIIVMYEATYFGICTAKEDHKTKPYVDLSITDNYWDICCPDSQQS